MLNKNFMKILIVSTLMLDLKIKKANTKYSKVLTTNIMAIQFH